MCSLESLLEVMATIDKAIDKRRTVMAAEPVTRPAPWSARRNRWVRAIGVAAILAIALDVYLGLWVTPPDKVQGNLVRLLYIHPALATVALYVAFALAALSSALWLWRRTRAPFFDRLAAASVETGIVFIALTIVTGSLWGRPVWGVYWTWDATLTSTALLLLLFLGYVAIRKSTADPQRRARRSAITALVAFMDVPLIQFSVLWWKTLHQKSTVLNPSLTPKIGGIMGATLALSFVAFLLLFVWMLINRYRIEVLKESLEGAEMEVAIRERVAEAGTSGHLELPADLRVPVSGG
jgi:heme exporter protein C